MKLNCNYDSDTDFSLQCLSLNTLNVFHQQLPVLSPYGTNMSLTCLREERKQLSLTYRTFPNDMSSKLVQRMWMYTCAINKYKNTAKWSQHLIHFPAHWDPLVTLKPAQQAVDMVNSRPRLNHHKNCISCYLLFLLVCNVKIWVTLPSYRQAIYCLLP